MDFKKMKIAIEQAQKVCNEMNKCANKFILQDSLNEMKQALNIQNVSNQRELLIAYGVEFRDSGAEILNDEAIALHTDKFLSNLQLLTVTIGGVFSMPLIECQALFLKIEL